MSTEQEIAMRVLALIPVGINAISEPMTALSAASAIALRDGASLETVYAGRVFADDEIAKAASVDSHKIWLCSHAGLDEDSGPDQLADACAQALTAAELGMPGVQELVLLPAGALGEEIAARLAIRFKGVALGRCKEIRMHPTKTEAKQVVCGGRAQLSIESKQSPCFAVLRVKNEPATSNQNRLIHEAKICRIELGASPCAQYATALLETGLSSRRLEGSKAIVSGGRGMAGETGFAMLQDLADCLGAAVGGSLPAVDAGWVPVSHQVGQSGKYVSPELYVAVAVSGTPQHMAGIDPGVRIVAINSDPEADIFKFAEVGMVGNWNDVLPAVIDQLRAAQSH